MLREYLQNFILFTIGLAIIAGLIGLVRYRQLSLSLRYLTLLACFDVAMELTAHVTKYVLHLKNNQFLFPFISIGELVLLAIAYRRVLQSVSFNKALPWILGAFSAYALFVSFSQWGMARYAVGLSIVVNLLMLGLAGLYFRKLLDELQVAPLRTDPFFWVSAGLAIYGLGNLLISLFSNYIITYCSVPLQMIIMWGVRNLFNVIIYLSYCWALWIASPKSQVEPVTASIQPRA